MIEPHNPTPEPILCDKKDGQWYAQDGVDVKETQQRKGMVYCSLCVIFISKKAMIIKTLDLKTHNQFIHKVIAVVSMEFGS